MPVARMKFCASGVPVAASLRTVAPTASGFVNPSV
jgi:hypothetical protein